MNIAMCSAIVSRFADALLLASADWRAAYIAAAEAPTRENLDAMQRAEDKVTKAEMAAARAMGAHVQRFGPKL